MEIPVTRPLRMPRTRPTLVIGFALVMTSCVSGALWSEYTDHAYETDRSTAEGFVGYLKSTRFKNGELDAFPRFAIILYDGQPERVLDGLGLIAERDYRAYELGSSVPNRVHVVTAAEGRPAFAVNRGLPGAGGVSTQAAELAALGVEYIVHIGICGLIGPTLPEGRPIVARGAYKDGAAVMLSRGHRVGAPVARPDEDLAARLATEMGADAVGGLGYTMPIFYLQPKGLQRRLLTASNLRGGPAPTYVEMEQAPFFETCHWLNVRCASLVSGSDRMTLDGDRVAWTFHDLEQGLPKLAMVRAAVEVFRALDAQPAPR